MMRQGGRAAAPERLAGTRFAKSLVARRYGFFQRSVTLPSAVDQSKVNASYKNGVLSVTLDKKEPSKSRNIQVKVE